MTDARLTDTRLRELYAQGLDASGGRKSEHCPAPDVMLALVRGEGDERERLATLDHVMACSECSREFELLRAIDRASAESASGGVPAATRVTPMPRSGSWRRYAPLALAASIIVAVGVILLDRDVERDVLRGDVTSVALVGPQGEAQAGLPIDFTWRRIADALRYELEVLDATGNVAYSATTADTTAMAPGASLKAGDYRWWVRASTGTGDQRVSEMRRLRVRSQ